MNIKSLLFGGTLFVGFLLFFFAVKSIGLGGIAEALSSISFGQFVILLVLNFAGMMVSTWRWKIIMHSLDAPISLAHITMAKFIGFSISYLLPSIFYGGEPFKLFFLRSEARIPLKKSVAPLIINEILFLGASLVLIVIGLVYLFKEVFLPYQLMVVLFVILALLFVVSYIFYRSAIGSPEGEKGFFSRLLEAFHLDRIKAVFNAKGQVIEIENDIRVFFQTKRSVLAFSIVLSFVENFLYLATYWLTVVYLGYQVGFYISLPILSTTYLNYLLPIPGALGSFELSQSYMFGILGMGGAIGLAFSLITRVVNLFFVGVGLVILGYFEAKVIGKKARGKIINLAARTRKKILANDAGNEIKNIK